MRFYIYHGRLSPDTGATDIEGNEIDDWGFEGPDFPTTGISYTYGTFTVHFETQKEADRAMALTGWQSGVHEYCLELEFESDCLRTWNAARQRHEYFGDWGIK